MCLYDPDPEIPGDPGVECQSGFLNAEDKEGFLQLIVAGLNKEACDSNDFWFIDCLDGANPFCAGSGSGSGGSGSGSWSSSQSSDSSDDAVVGAHSVVSAADRFQNLMPSESTTYINSTLAKEWLQRHRHSSSSSQAKQSQTTMVVSLDDNIVKSVWALLGFAIVCIAVQCTVCHIYNRKNKNGTASFE